MGDNCHGGVMEKKKTLLFFFAFFALIFAAACSNSTDVACDTEDLATEESFSCVGSSNSAESDTTEIIPNDTTAQIVGIESMHRLSGGTVTLGSNGKEFKTNETPAMKVVLNYDFYMDVHEVTCGEYENTAKKTGLKRFGCKGDSLPVTNVTYFDAILFANAKSKKEKRDTAYTYSKATYDSEGHCTDLEGISFHPEVDGFRLPTEAEWIFAATRAWDTTKSWNSENSGFAIHEVCGQGTDSAGFCDLAGNVTEWVNDWLGLFRDTMVTNYVGAPDGGEKGERIVKGGNYTSSVKEINVISRGDIYTVTSSTRAEYVGFRLALGKIPDAHWMNSDDKPHTNVDTTLIDSKSINAIIEEADSLIPKLYIYYESIQASEYTPAFFRLVDAREHYPSFSSTPDFEGFGYIKIRGNSTATAPKKPYNIKFDDKKDFFGMGRAKKWALLSNPFDPTLIRNKLIYDLAKKFNFIYTPNSYFIDVWVNGKFAGNYQLSEKVEFKKNRIPYDTNNGDFLFEAVEKRKKDGVTYTYSPLDSFRIALKEPSSLSEAQHSLLLDKLNDIENSISTRDIMEYMKFVDLRSMIDYYWIEEFVNDPDLHTGSRYFTIHDGILRGGPVWDFDLAMGNTNTETRARTTGTYARRIWWNELYKDSVFEKIAYERFLQIEPYFDNLVNDNDFGKNKLDSLIAFFGSSFQKNFSDSGWVYCDGKSSTEAPPNRMLSCPYNPIPKPTYEENILFLRNWITQRNAYLKDHVQARLSKLSHIKESLEGILAIQDSIFANRIKN